MKKIVSVILVLTIMIAVMPLSASAAGKLATTQENFFVVNSYKIYGYAYARIENVGDKPVEYSAGLLEIYDANGDTLTSDTYLSVYGKYLQPGEYAYVKVYDSIDTAESYSDVDDYMLTVTGKSSSGNITKRFACETQWIPDYQISKYSTRDYMFATFTNDSSETVYDIEVVLALLDDDDNILYVDTVGLYSAVGVNPGSTITVKTYVSDSMTEAFERDGYTATHVDAFAYVYVEE